MRSRSQSCTTTSTVTSSTTTDGMDERRRGLVDGGGRKRSHSIDQQKDNVHVMVKRHRVEKILQVQQCKRTAAPVRMEQTPNTPTPIPTNRSPSSEASSYQTAWVRSANGASRMIIIPRPLLMKHAATQAPNYSDASCQTDLTGALMIWDHFGQVKTER